MIAAHNSFTCYEPKNKLFNLVKWLWKCQYTTNDIDKLNVNYFDVRVRYDEKTNTYITCHGLVDLNYSFNTMNDIFNFFENHQGRLIIERGDTEIPELQFKRNFRVTNLEKFIIKKDWKVVYINENYKQVTWEDLTYQYWQPKLSIIENIKRLFAHRCTIKSYALLIKQFIKNKSNVITFIDYCKVK
jgi:hypothetical protein